MADQSFHDINVMLAFRSKNAKGLDYLAESVRRFNLAVLQGDPDAEPFIAVRPDPVSLSIEYDLPTLRRWFAFHGATEDSMAERLQHFFESTVRAAQEQLDAECVYSEFPVPCLQTEGPE